MRHPPEKKNKEARLYKQTTMHCSVTFKTSAVVRDNPALNIWTRQSSFGSRMTKISAPTAARCSGRCIRKWEQKNRQQVHQTWGLVTVTAFYFFISERREPAAAQILSADKLIRVHQMFRSSVLYNCDSSAVFLCRETDALGWPRLWGVKDQISNPEC